MSKSIRLNMELRERILDAVVAKAEFGNRLDDFSKARTTIAREVYASMFTPSQKKLLARMPDSWCYYNSYVHVDGGPSASWTSYYFSEEEADRGRRYGTSFKDANPKHLKKFPGAKSHIVSFHSLPKDLQDKIRDLTVAELKLREDKDSIFTHARAVLNGCSTDNVLRERWPEISSIVDDVIGGYHRAAVTVPIGDLNKRLGL